MGQIAAMTLSTFPLVHLKSFTVQPLEFISFIGCSNNAVASSVFPNSLRFNFIAASSSVSFLQVSHQQPSLGVSTKSNVE